MIMQKMRSEILARTSELFKITFTEVEENNYDDAQMRFSFYETTGGSVSYAYYPSMAPFMMLFYMLYEQRFLMTHHILLSALKGSLLKQQDMK